jgi:3-hydroxyisobutyrate dehydrogenase-like beta-hydroxyacid dehydrogenase
MTSTAYAFIGTGAMGRPMAARLIGAGLPLTVNNRSRGKAESLLAAGARWAQDPAEAANNADVVLTCVTNNEQRRTYCSAATA